MYCLRNPTKSPTLIEVNRHTSNVDGANRVISHRSVNARLAYLARLCRCRNSPGYSTTVTMLARKRRIFLLIKE